MYKLFNKANGSGAPIPEVSGPALAEMPSVTTLDVSVYPEAQLKIADTQTNWSTCWWWEKTEGEQRAVTSVISVPQIPVAGDQVAKVVQMVKVDVEIISIRQSSKAFSRKTRSANRIRRPGARPATSRRWPARSCTRRTWAPRSSTYRRCRA
jgi:hypothetical protein